MATQLCFMTNSPTVGSLPSLRDPSVPTDECIAVSTSSDATGSYNRYGFHLGTNFFDYPHLGVWPDAYYMAMDVYNSAGTVRLGPQPFAFNRAAMLSGASGYLHHYGDNRRIWR